MSVEIIIRHKAIYTGEERKSRAQSEWAHSIPLLLFTLDLADKFFCKLQCPCSIMTESGRAAVALLDSGVDCCLMAGPGPQSRSLFRFRRPPLRTTLIQMFMRWGRGGHLSAGMMRRRGCHWRESYYQLCPRKPELDCISPAPSFPESQGAPTLMCPCLIHVIPEPHYR